MRETGISTSAEAGTVRFHRVLRARPELVFKAFVTPLAYARWLPPRGYFAELHAMDARQGGSFRMSFTDFGSGFAHAFAGRFLDFEPGRRLRYATRFDDPGLPGEMETAIDIGEVACGSEIAIVQSGIPDAIPLDQCYLGWQDSLMFLALMVEGHDR